MKTKALKDSEVRGVCQHYDRASHDVIASAERVSDTQRRLALLNKQVEDTERSLLQAERWRSSAEGILSRARKALREVG